MSEEQLDIFQTIELKQETWWVKLKLLSPMSHHEPNSADKSNRNLFRRQAKILGNGKQSEVNLEQLNLDKVKVPSSIACIFENETIDTFIASSLFAAFISAYGAGEGSGLFSGIQRYRFLEERFAQAATISSSLLEMWGNACRLLQTPALSKYDAIPILEFFKLPNSIQIAVLRNIASKPRSALMLAQVWVDSLKLRSEKYAKASGKEQNNEEMVNIDFTNRSISCSENIVNILNVSANTIRHQMVREPAMLYMYDQLGLNFDETNNVVTSLFYNGGSVKKGGSVGGNIFWTRKTAKEKYPILGLISGCTNDAILGDGNLSIHSWVVCKENQNILDKVNITASSSINEMVDEWTLNHHVNRIDGSPMPFDFETLMEGSEIVVRFGFSPYSNQLQRGALASAVETFKKTVPFLGGQSARGFGYVNVSMIENEGYDKSLAAYSKYLQDNKTSLKDGLLDGTLGNKTVIISE